ncbi:uncharacterized protein LOC143230184 isoform X3 [Tachypleus tridentatus]|uniref:uncharacterized protein LOC143230184 isoform X3 n=1 Tax=Tachypleus tridentatus TaxID=6853 RepID=UPI003FD283CC
MGTLGLYLIVFIVSVGVATGWIRPRCFIPHAPLNGFSFHIRVGQMQKVKYRCYPGYQQFGSSIAYCVNGKWSVSTPECVHPNSVGDGDQRNSFWSGGYQQPSQTSPPSFTNGRTFHYPSQTSPPSFTNGRTFHTPSQTSPPSFTNGRTFHTPSQTSPPSFTNGRTFHSPSQTSPPSFMNGHNYQFPQQTSPPSLMNGRNYQSFSRTSFPNLMNGRNYKSISQTSPPIFVNGRNYQSRRMGWQPHFRASGVLVADSDHSSNGLINRHSLQNKPSISGFAYTQKNLFSPHQTTTSRSDRPEQDITNYGLRDNTSRFRNPYSRYFKSSYSYNSERNITSSNVPDLTLARIQKRIEMAQRSRYAMQNTRYTSNEAVNDIPQSANNSPVSIYQGISKTNQNNKHISDDDLTQLRQFNSPFSSTGVSSRQPINNYVPEAETSSTWQSDTMEDSVPQHDINKRRLNNQRQFGAKTQSSGNPYSSHKLFWDDQTRDRLRQQNEVIQERERNSFQQHQYEYQLRPQYPDEQTQEVSQWPETWTQKSTFEQQHGHQLSSPPLFNGQFQLPWSELNNKNQNVFTTQFQESQRENRRHQNQNGEQYITSQVPYTREDTVTSLPSRVGVTDQREDALRRQYEQAEQRRRQQEMALRQQQQQQKGEQFPTYQLPYSPGEIQSSEQPVGRGEQREEALRRQYELAEQRRRQQEEALRQQQQQQKGEQFPTSQLPYSPEEALIPQQTVDVGQQREEALRRQYELAEQRRRQQEEALSQQQQQQQKGEQFPTSQLPYPPEEAPSPQQPVDKGQQREEALRRQYELAEQRRRQEEALRQQQEKGEQLPYYREEAPSQQQPVDKGQQREEALRRQYELAEQRRRQQEEALHQQQQKGEQFSTSQLPYSPEEAPSPQQPVDKGQQREEALRRQYELAEQRRKQQEEAQRQQQQQQKGEQFPTSQLPYSPEEALIPQQTVDVGQQREEALRRQYELAEQRRRQQQEAQRQQQQQQKGEQFPTSQLPYSPEEALIPQQTVDVGQQREEALRRQYELAEQRRQQEDALRQQQQQQQKGEQFPTSQLPYSVEEAPSQQQPVDKGQQREEALRRQYELAEQRRRQQEEALHQQQQKGEQFSTSQLPYSPEEAPSPQQPVDKGQQREEALRRQYELAEQRRKQQEEAQRQQQQQQKGEQFSTSQLPYSPEEALIPQQTVDVGQQREEALRRQYELAEQRRRQQQEAQRQQQQQQKGEQFPTSQLPYSPEEALIPQQTVDVGQQREEALRRQYELAEQRRQQEDALRQQQQQQQKGEQFPTSQLPYSVEEAPSPQQPVDKGQQREEALRRQYELAEQRRREQEEALRQQQEKGEQLPYYREVAPSQQQPFDKGQQREEALRRQYELAEQRRRQQEEALHQQQQKGEQFSTSQLPYPPEEAPSPQQPVDKGQQREEALRRQYELAELRRRQQEEAQRQQQQQQKGEQFPTSQLPYSPEEALIPQQTVDVGQQREEALRRQYELAEQRRREQEEALRHHHQQQKGEQFPISQLPYSPGEVQSSQQPVGRGEQREEALRRQYELAEQRRRQQEEAQRQQQQQQKGEQFPTSQLPYSPEEALIPQQTVDVGQQREEALRRQYELAEQRRQQEDALRQQQQQQQKGEQFPTSQLPYSVEEAPSPQQPVDKGQQREEALRRQYELAEQRRREQEEALRQQQEKGEQLPHYREEAPSQQQPVDKGQQREEALRRQYELAEQRRRQQEEALHQQQQKGEQFSTSQLPYSPEEALIPQQTVDVGQQREEALRRQYELAEQRRRDQEEALRQQQEKGEQLPYYREEAPSQQQPVDKGQQREDALRRQYELAEQRRRQQEEALHQQQQKGEQFSTSQLPYSPEEALIPQQTVDVGQQREEALRRQYELAEQRRREQEEALRRHHQQQEGEQFSISQLPYSPGEVQFSQQPVGRGEQREEALRRQYEVTEQRRRQQEEVLRQQQRQQKGEQLSTSQLPYSPGEVQSSQQPVDKGQQREEALRRQYELDEQRRRQQEEAQRQQQQQQKGEQFPTSELPYPPEEAPSLQQPVDKGQQREEALRRQYELAEQRRRQQEEAQRQQQQQQKGEQFPTSELPYPPEEAPSPQQPVDKGQQREEALRRQYELDEQRRRQQEEAQRQQQQQQKGEQFPTSELPYPPEEAPSPQQPVDKGQQREEALRRQYELAEQRRRQQEEAQRQQQQQEKGEQYLTPQLPYSPEEVLSPQQQGDRGEQREEALRRQYELAEQRRRQKEVHTTSHTTSDTPSAPQLRSSISSGTFSTNIKREKQSKSRTISSRDSNRDEQKKPEKLLGEDENERTDSLESQSLNKNIRKERLKGSRMIRLKMDEEKDKSSVDTENKPRPSRIQGRSPLSAHLMNSAFYVSFSPAQVIQRVDYDSEQNEVTSSRPIVRVNSPFPVTGAQEYEWLQGLAPDLRENYIREVEQARSKEETDGVRAGEFLRRFFSSPGRATSGPESTTQLPFQQSTHAMEPREEDGTTKPQIKGLRSDSTADDSTTITTTTTIVTSNNNGGLYDHSCLQRQVNRPFIRPPNISHGSPYKYERVLNKYTSNFYLIALYRCDPGFTLAEPTVNTLFCQQRKWVGDIPVCVKNGF